MQPWSYENQPLLEIDANYVGFVYQITNIDTGMSYFGKKKAWFKKTSVRTVTLKNGTKKKKKIRTLVPSDWQTYYGSSEQLKADVDKFGTDKFDRKIIRFCKTLAELSYYEAKIQFEHDVLLKPDLYYNRWIMVRVRSDHLHG